MFVEGSIQHFDALVQVVNPLSNDWLFLRRRDSAAWTAVFECECQSAHLYPETVPKVIGGRVAARCFLQVIMHPSIAHDSPLRNHNAPPLCFTF
jgi:hypothetical protein